MKQKNQSEMTPEDYFRMQKISQDVTQRAGTKTPQEALEVKKKQLKEVQKIKAMEKQPQIAPVPEMAEMSIEDKVSLVAKGLVYNNWVVTLLFSAVLILLAVIYPFPFNLAIIAMAFGMDVITWWTMRKYMK